MPQLQQRLEVTDSVWLARDVIDRMEADANEHAPCETGGILLGYWGPSRKDAVATHFVGAGPNARRTEYWFAPDHEYQEAEVERLYHESGRVLNYLGDWHSHPGGGGSLSWRDRATLRRISRCGPARLEIPLMVIVAGGPSWEIHGWQRSREKCYLWTRFVVREVNVRVFDAS